MFNGKETMTKSMKKKLFAIAVIIICFTVMVSGTVAYFVADTKFHNLITSGGIDVKLIEKTKGDGGALVDFPEGGISGIMPGARISKIVSVENIGESTAWIRVKVSNQFESKDGEKLPEKLATGEDVVSYAVDENKWTLFEGWYYYLDAVDPKEVTEVLFEEVRFSIDMTNEYQGSTAHIEIHAQAVQTENNSDNALLAKGWPSEEAE